MSVLSGFIRTERTRSTMICDTKQLFVLLREAGLRMGSVHL
jgi:hypothetical protein